MLLFLMSILYRLVCYEMFVRSTELMHTGEVASARWHRHVSFLNAYDRSRRKLISCCESIPDLLGRILSTVLVLLVLLVL
jgi:hypothetical protein